MFTLTVVDQSGDIDVYHYDAEFENEMQAAISRFNELGYQTSYYFEDVR